MSLQPLSGWRRLHQRALGPDLGPGAGKPTGLDSFTARPTDFQVVLSGTGPAEAKSHNHRDSPQACPAAEGFRVTHLARPRPGGFGSGPRPP